MMTYTLHRRPSTPGEILKDLFLDERGVSISALAEAIGYSRKQVSEVIHGRARIEARLAARLAKVFGTSTEFWLRLQAAVDAWDAEREAERWSPPRTFKAATA